MRTLLGMCFIWAFVSSPPVLADSKNEADFSKLPVEETCSREYVRWQYLHLAGNIESKAQAEDWEGAIQEASIFKGVWLTCWERYSLSMDMSAIHAANGDVTIANAYLQFIEGLEGLASFQLDRLEDAKEKLELGEWGYKGFIGNEESERLIAENAPDRPAYPIKAPDTRAITKVLRRYSHGKAICYVMLDVDIEGKPFNLFAKCSSDKVVKAVTKAVSKARFSPKLVEGEPAIHYGIMYPFELVID